jgi:hypothetical protein
MLHTLGAAEQLIAQGLKAPAFQYRSKNERMLRGSRPGERRGGRERVPKKAKVIADEYGFAISPKLASAYRDIELELRTLNREATRKIPAIAEKIKKSAALHTAAGSF